MINPLLLFAAEAEQAPGIVDKILSPQVLPLLIPIAAIVGAFALTITMAIIRHRERMAGVRPPAKDDGKCGP
jgi:hypothetical protein